MKKLRLGVNIDHVATVRNARGGARPDPVRAALLGCPHSTVRIACDGAQVVVSFGELITDPKQLTGAIDVALAIAKGP